MQEHLNESQKLQAKQQHIAQEKACIEQEKAITKAERLKLEVERDKEAKWISVEKETQLKEWAELNQEKRRIAIALKEEEEKTQQEKVTHSS